MSTATASEIARSDDRAMMMSVESIQGPIFGLGLTIASIPSLTGANRSARTYEMSSGLAASDAAL
jgi:hypothetical protein